MSRTWPFGGRAQETERIRQVLGEGRSVVLAGPAGVGKSRLAAEAAPGAPRVRATEAAASLPLGAFAPLLPAGDAGDNLLGWAARAVRAAVGDGVLVVDDGHLLDPASAALLRQLSDAGMRMVVTVRTGEPCPDAVASLWQEDQAARIEVGPLPAEEVAGVLESVLGARVAAGTAGRLAELSRGNPLYLRELVAGALERGTLATVDGLWRMDGAVELSGRLSELIAARIGDLTPVQLEVLELVALGEPLGLLPLAAHTDETALEQVEERALIHVAPEEGRRTNIRLGHPLYGEAVRAGMPRLRRLRRYRQLAEMAESTGLRRREDAMRLALWRLESGTATDPEPLIAALRLAWAAHDYPLAERFGWAAMEAGGGPRAAVLYAPVLGYGGQLDRAEAVLASVWDEPCDERTRTLMISSRLNTLAVLGRTDEAIALVEDAARTLTDEENRQEMTFWQAGVQFALGDFEAALALTDTIVAAPVSVPMEAQGHGQRAWILGFTGRPLDAIAATDRALATREQWQDAVPVYHRALLELRRMATIFAGDLAGTAEVVEEIKTVGAGAGDWAVARSESDQAEGVLERHRGRVRTALRLLTSENAAAALSDHHIQRSAEVAITAALAGDADTAVAALESAEQSAPLVVLGFGADLARPWVAAARGEPGRAAEFALDGARRMREAGAYSQEVVALHDAVRLGAAGSVAGPAAGSAARSRAGSVADRLAELAGTCQGEFVAVAAAHAAAAAADDGAALVRAADAFERLGFVLLAAEASAQAAAAFEASGRQASARSATTRAWVLASACEGAITPALARLSAPQLTDREREIARLAADDASNKEIAGRLVLSVRTVENHLHAAYVKLGVTSRAELKQVLRPPDLDRVLG
ncbi:LuxR C-terminal-related transcriptional regulator [Streptomyces sp. SKN60]|uniref:helix-turn-helix transcriptional regulator n=1 Tax=Streptomyces sp. SKN60 TaxID=2855506 RepID=UPI0022474179|nr:LuxR C-terminal-related transcriptional regulator [Streptomyces sp. SKN60]MCX2185789.1 LuxR C-terminal-related transcriptional regulator [Streptomyces sp. SKN60]